MVSIYVKEYISPGYRWKPLEEGDIATFLGDPVRTGNIVLHKPESPILEKVTEPSSREQFNGFFQNSIHFATNYGLAGFFGNGTTHISIPETKGYILIQLTDMIADIGKFPERSSVRVNLIANMMKMSDIGTFYRVDSTFDEIMEELRENYRFIGPEEGKMFSSWLLKDIRQEVNRQREASIDDEFVERVNKLHSDIYHPGCPKTEEELKKHFLRKSSPI